MANLPTEGIAINELPVVGSVTNQDILHMYQSNRSVQVSAGQVSDYVLNNISNSSSVTGESIDGIVCIKDGVITQVTPEFYFCEVLFSASKSAYARNMRIEILATP